MARKSKAQEKIYTCTAEFTPGCDERLTKALVDIYYRRKRMGIEIKKEKEEETA